MLSIVGTALVGTACTTSSPPEVPRSDAASEPPATSFGSNDRATIAFHSDPGGRDDTYVMSGEGTRPTPVTDGSETIAQPVWSPDGRRMAITCCTSDPGHLFVVDGPGATPIDLAPDVAGAANPSWSPGGSAIAFESTDDGLLYLVDVTGAEPGLPHTLGVAGAAPSWSPDGRHIAFFNERDDDLDIFTMAVDGTGVERLTHDRAPDYSPVWSPNGRHIAFVSERDGDQDIYVMDADGSHQIDVSRDRWPDDFPAWSPDGRDIAFVAYLHGADPHTIGDGDAEIFVVAADGTHLRDVSRNRAWDGDPSWSPDGGRIAFTRRTGHAQVMVMRADGSDQQRLRGMPGMANDCCPAWRP
ncbi:MAG: hypothetical protein ABI595_13880 [Actinomycetota bacterium]